jgi:UDP-2,3-diacylglucosamine pyrophosphatase LpxH
MSLSFKTLWISDVHLGTSASRAADLLEFLSSIHADRIYLVGDIIDLEKMRVRPQFPDLHRQLVSLLIHLGNTISDVTFIPGNHDHQFRDLAGRDICGIPVRLEAEHLTATGRRLLIAHGDILDGRIRKGTNLEKFGAAAYAVLTRLDVLVNELRSRLGHDYVSVMSQIKHRLSSANEYIRRFEEVAASYARERDYDGIVCGHIHRPGIREIDGVLYANDGDWVEHRTALAEDDDGTLRILRWEGGRVDAEAVVMFEEAAPIAA